MARSNPLVRRPRRIAAALAALALALPAQAQRTTKKSTPAAPAKAPAAAPAPEVAAAPPAAAYPAASPGRSGFFAARGPSSMGLGVGLFSADKGSGLAVQLDYGFVRTPPSWTRLELELRLRAMYAMPSKDTGLSRVVIVGVTPTPMPTGMEKASASVAEIGPFARVRLPLSPKLAAFADAGVGIAQTFEKVDRDEMYVGHTIVKKNVTTLYFGGALGLAYDLNERWRAMIPLAFSAQAGSDYSSFQVFFAVSYRL